MHRVAASGPPTRTLRSLHAALLACALFGFPLISTLPVFLGVDSRPISLTYRAVIAVATVFIIWHTLVNGRPFARRGHLLIALATMAVPLARLAWDALVTPLPLDLDWGEIWPFAVGAAYLPATAFLVRMDEDTLDLARRYALRLGLLAAVCIGAAGLVALRDIETFLRLETPVLNPISIGHVGVSLFVLVMLRHDGEARTGGGRRAASVFATALGALLASALLIASGSMGPAVAWVIVLGGWFLSHARASLARGRGLVGVAVPVAAVVVVVAGLLVLHSLVPIPLFDRLIDVAREQSTSERVRLLTQAIAQFEESPWLGSSVFEYESRLYPHNVFVEALLVGGVVGLVPLLMLFYESGRIALGRLLRAGRDRWLALLCLQYFTDVMFSGSLYFSAPFWAVTLAMLGLAGYGSSTADARRPRFLRSTAARTANVPDTSR